MVSTSLPDTVTYDKIKTMGRIQINLDQMSTMSKLSLLAVIVGLCLAPFAISSWFNSLRSKSTAGTANLVTTGDHSPAYYVDGDANFWGHTNTVRFQPQTEGGSVSNNGTGMYAVWADQKVELEEGKLFRAAMGTGNYTFLDVMMRGGELHVDYIQPDGASSYLVADTEQNIKYGKMAYQLSEYEVVIPKGWELQRNVTPLSNGHQRIEIQCKWGRGVDMVVNAEGKLRELTVHGGIAINDAKKTISPRPPEEMSPP